MRGDRLIIAAHHTAAATELCELLRADRPSRLVITVSGESGAGKSELGSEVARLLTDAGVPTAVIQQDDYFVFPPRTNHEMRRVNVEQVGLYEVKLGLLDSNMRSFKRGENPIYKPIIDYDADAIGWEELDLGSYEAVVVEGTYTATLRFADRRIFIDRTYEQTKGHRQERNRDADEPFMDDVLRREHEIISSHRELADYVVAADFSVTRGEPRGD